MLDMLQYDFMQRAFIVGILIALMIPCIGMIVVLKRLSMIGDALSHSSLAGVTIGLIAGINPILTSVIFCIVSAFIIEWIRKKFPHFGEISIAVVMSFGIGLAGVLSGFVGNSSNFNSFLFGSIVAITDFELYLVISISLVVLVTFGLLYKELFFVAMDEKMAKMAGVPVKGLHIIFTILTAITVSVAARTVGALIVSSMMVLPVVGGMQLGKSYFQTLVMSIGLALGYTIIGLVMSFYIGLKPGGTIVLISVIGLLLILLVKKVRGYGQG